MSAEHIKCLGQYFTNDIIANFMCSWACQGAKTMLDPAVGNGIFFRYAKKYNPECKVRGYEIDKEILEYFGNLSDKNIILGDYLKSSWGDKYDAIICNPPYKRFQAIPDRTVIIQDIYNHTSEKYSSYTNLYLLFLVKSIFQLSSTGRLAYLIPTEFLNAKYGTPVKRLILERQLLRTVINFRNNREVFKNAATTCCILLLDQEKKEYVDFYNLKSVKDLANLKIETGINAVRISYPDIEANKKWRPYLLQEEKSQYENLTEISNFCTVSRGIATGANKYFCFSRSKAERYGIPRQCLEKCICRSADVRTSIFSQKEFEKLSEEDKTVYLLNIDKSSASVIQGYIKFGEENGVDQKYLTSHRDPWFSMEQKQVAPIWVSSSSRKNIKFVRNLAMAKTLTTFHSIFVKEEYLDDIDLIFCYFLTPIAQSILGKNRKEMADGLNKFQPNDINSAKMLDLNVISKDDRARIYEIYDDMKREVKEQHIWQLDQIMSDYLLPK